MVNNFFPNLNTCMRLTIRFMAKPTDFADINLSTTLRNPIFMAVDPNIVFLVGTLIPTAVGAAGLYNALKTYKDGQVLKRKDLIIPLIDEFDNSEDLFLAKAILDDFTCNIPPSGTKNQILKDLFNMSQDDFEYYKRSNLRKFLRYHRDPKAEPVTDFKERAVRRSFDSMIYFFFKLQYLHRIGLLDKKELYYFKYYMNLAFQENDTGLWEYIDRYRLQLDRNFVKEVTNLKEVVT